MYPGFERIVSVKLLTLALCLVAALLAQPRSDRQQRLEKLEKSLLAPCCWAEPIATHRSEVALAMKAEIARFVADGKSDREILDYYKGHYGARVLVEPEGAKWWWMHVVPVIMLAVGLAVAVLVLRRWLRPLPAS